MLYLLLFYGMQDIGETDMIINSQRQPDFSLYYLGSLMLDFLKKSEAVPIDDLFINVQKKVKEQVHVDFMYYALDWLYLLGLVEMKEGRVYYENKKVNSIQTGTFERDYARAYVQ